MTASDSGCVETGWSGNTAIILAKTRLAPGNQRRQAFNKREQEHRQDQRLSAQAIGRR
jgi:hypothetical protein